jgi:hypothetical protein
MCCGIWTVGASVYLVQCFTGPACPVLVPLSAAGGGIWCLANLLLVPIVNTIGVGLCMVCWGAVEMLTGWATARFGLLGLTRQSVSNSSLNYAGVALGVASLLLLSQVHSAVSDGSDKEPAAGAAAASLQQPPGSEQQAALLLAEELAEEEGQESQEQAAALQQAAAFELSGYDFSAQLSPRGKRAFGLSACLLAGCLSGSTFLPPQYVVDHAGSFPGASSSLLGQLFAHNCGILLTSVSVTALYAALSRNRPWVSSQLLLPSYLAGICWGLAMLCWFSANQQLSIVVAFPLVTLGPGVVSILLGGCFYGELKGTRNQLLTAAACMVFMGSAVCIALSSS